MERSNTAGSLRLCALAGVLANVLAGILTGVSCLHSIGYSQTSLKMTQLANLKLSQTGNAGIWGWVGPDGTEYALPTTRSGTAVVSLKDPRNPKELFHLASPPGTWQELLTVGHHLYKCAEQGTVGLQIFDLSTLPGTVPTELPGWKGVQTCHSLWSDTTVTPRRLYIEGSGDIKILSLADPAKPALLGTARTQIHDGMARRNRIYVSTGGGHTMDIWDAANPAAPVRLGRAMIGEVSAGLGEPQGYSHNVWLTDDNRYAFTTEETNGCTLKMWDISDEKAPKFTGGKFLKGTGMAHNAYVRKHLLYLSHYGQGVRVIDFRDPKNLVEVAFHSPGGSSWGCYPWLPSGLIIHGNGGLRVVEPDADIKITGGGVVSITKEHPDFRFTIAADRGGGLRFSLPETGPYAISVFNHAGKEIFKDRGRGAAGMQIPVLERGAAAGGYVLRLNQGTGVFTAQLPLAR